MGRFFGVLPTLRASTPAERPDSLVETGFEIDRALRPGGDRTLFVVAKKAGGPPRQTRGEHASDVARR